MIDGAAAYQPKTIVALTTEKEKEAPTTGFPAEDAPSDGNSKCGKHGANRFTMSNGESKDNTLLKGPRSGRRIFVEAFMGHH